MDGWECANPECGKSIRPAKEMGMKDKDGIPYVDCPHCSAKNRLRDVIGSPTSGCPRYFKVDGLLED